MAPPPPPPSWRGARGTQFDPTVVEALFAVASVTPGAPAEAQLAA